MSLGADALVELASLVETRTSVRAALIDWHRFSPDLTIARVSRRASIGAPLSRSLEPIGADPNGSMVARAVEAHAIHGGGLADTLRGLGAAVERRDGLVHEAESASSASKLSTRLLAGLAAVCMLLIPAWHRVPVRDIVLSSLAALILAGAGTAWMRKLQPRPPLGDHPVAAIADLTAALLGAGLSLGPALELACPADLVVPRRLVRLGMSWPAALGRSDDKELHALGDVLRITYQAGIPSGDMLRRLAVSLREARRRECELAAKRAPILLVLPLTLCFLPAFALLMVVPLLRGLAG